MLSTTVPVTGTHSVNSTLVTKSNLSTTYFWLQLEQSRVTSENCDRRSPVKAKPCWESPDHFLPCIVNSISLQLYNPPVVYIWCSFLSSPNFLSFFCPSLLSEAHKYIIAGKWNKKFSFTPLVHTFSCFASFVVDYIFQRYTHVGSLLWRNYHLQEEFITPQQDISCLKPA